MYVVLVTLLLVSLSFSQTCDNSDDFTVKKDNNVVFRVSPIGDIAGCQNARNICQSLDDAKQTLDLVGGLLSISSGNSVTLPDDSNTNELQNLTIAGQLLTLTDGNSVSLPVQFLSIDSNGTLSITDGNSIQLPDSSPTNELQSLGVNGRLLSLSDSNTVTVPVQSLTLGGGVLSLSDSNSVTLPDTSSTNELQTLSLNGGVVSLSSGNNITLPDASSTNEIQSLSITGNTLSISSANTITLSGCFRSRQTTNGGITTLTATNTPLFFGNSFITVNVVAANTIVVSGGVTLGTTAVGGAGSLTFGTCYRSGATLIMAIDYSAAISFPQNMRSVLSIEGTFSGLNGNVDVGLCYNSVANSNWNSNDWYRVVVTVY